MTNSFAALKRSAQSDLEKLTAQIEKTANPQTKSNSYEDERIWKPTVDKAGNGYAVIRFLPASEGEDVPWVRVFNHGFQGPGGWYIENSLTTLNKKDPVSEYNSQLWNSGVEKNKEIARKQKRRLSYYSNIYVVSDSANPENEGKVMIFKYGKKIFDKLMEAMNPEFEDEAPVNPFDLWGGANFKLKIRNVEGYRNYDKSEFDSASALSEDDAELERIWNSQFKLNEFVDDKNFKTYDELKARLNKVLGLEGDTYSPAPVREEPVFEAPSAPSEPRSTVEDDTPSWNDNTSDTDDDLSYFESLAAED
jgi:hypothetical protein